MTLFACYFVVLFPCRLSQEEFDQRRSMMKDKIRDMIKKPGFPGDVSFGEVSCFDDRLVSGLRKKIKMLIDGYVSLCNHCVACLTNCVSSLEYIHIIICRSSLEYIIIII